MAERPIHPQELPAAENYYSSIIFISTKWLCYVKAALRVLGTGAALGVVVVTGISWDKYAKLPLFAYGILAMPTLVWNLAELTNLSLSRGNRGFNPGVCVALDLMIWATYVLAIGFTIGVAQLNVYEFDNDNTTFAAAQRSYTATIALPPILTAVHFVLFGIAWYEATARYRQLSQIAYARAGPDNTTYPPRERRFFLIPKTYVSFGSPASHRPKFQGLNNSEQGTVTSSPPPADVVTSQVLQQRAQPETQAPEKEHVPEISNSANIRFSSRRNRAVDPERTQKEVVPTNFESTVNKVSRPGTMDEQTLRDRPIEPEPESPVETRAREFYGNKSQNKAEESELDSRAKVELPDRGT